MNAKSLLSFVAAFSLASIGYAVDLGAVAFRMTNPKFESGDSITIREVTASSPDLKVGDTVIVRGSYRLQSRPNASLGFSLTSIGPSAATVVAPHQRQKIEAGSGTFELKHVIPADGMLHVSFYPQTGGSSFGGVYFDSAKP
ncbi:MAG: hypothetical protein V4662_15815 [Verrucomicrobiota bacterium]